MRAPRRASEQYDEQHESAGPHDAPLLENGGWQKAFLDRRRNGNDGELDDSGGKLAIRIHTEAVAKPGTCLEITPLGQHTPAAGRIVGSVYVTLSLLRVLEGKVGDEFANLAGGERRKHQRAGGD